MKKEEENKETMPEEEISQISPEIQKKLDEIKKTLEKFKEEVLKKYKNEVVGIELLPPEKEKKKSQEINILILIDDSEVQKVHKE